MGHKDHSIERITVRVGDDFDPTSEADTSLLSDLTEEGLGRRCDFGFYSPRQGTATMTLKPIVEDRCPYVCTDNLIKRTKIGEDERRCGLEDDHASWHILYLAGTDEVLYNGMNFELGDFSQPEVDGPAGGSEAIRPGSDQQRQSNGLPGHCEDCTDRGHVAVHPELGCSDVGCTSSHEDADEAAQRNDQRQKLNTWTEEVVAEAFGAIEIDGTNYLLDEDREQYTACGQVAVPLIRYADTGEVEARLTAWVELEDYQEGVDE